METLRYVVLANSLLVVVSLAFYGLLGRETFFQLNRLVLWLGLATVLVLPLLELPDWRPQPVRNVMQRTAQVVVPSVLPKLTPPDVSITFPNQQTYPAFQQQFKQFLWSWQLGLVTLYVVGVFVLLIRLVMQWFSLRRLISRSVQEPYDDFILLQNSQINAPFSFFSWVFINLNQHSPDELEQILRHERVHVLERHSLDMLGTELICIVFWFNPAAYLFRYLIRQTLEFRADAVVLQEGVDARAYQYNLLKSSLSMTLFGVTNNFSGSMLRQRISMINRNASGISVWWRYVVWAILMGIMAFACKHKSDDQNYFIKRSNILPTNATRTLAYELEQERVGWYRVASLLQPEKPFTKNGKKGINLSLFNYPEIICLRNGLLSLKNTDTLAVKLFINGQEKAVSNLSALTFDELGDVLIYAKDENAPEADKYPETYQILLSTTQNSSTQQRDLIRNKWKDFLIANAVSDYPLGQSNSFSMNQLLEALFFQNKHTFVARTKDDHLKLYDEFSQNIETYINGMPVAPKQIESVHIREIDRLYTRERPFDEWHNNSRFVLYIETAPKRAKRDSTYYVFSPFYSGDF